MTTEAKSRKLWPDARPSVRSRKKGKSTFAPNHYESVRIVTSLLSKKPGPAWDSALTPYGICAINILESQGKGYSKMKKLTWLSLALVLVLAIGAISFASAAEYETKVYSYSDPELDAYVRSIQGVARGAGDVNGDLTKPIAQFLLGDLFNEANWELYKTGYFISAQWGGGGSSS